ncbi:PhzF family phenazine biosynthesis protein [Pseudoalteromonas denitrificans]|jgi:PhzF family phenazine biosynthesis protein|uniref:Phenazine biosynthesis protein PhzF family n=1 Tax=Pseudoalteromonas denitrificans DSM 6059 TaxID=1123010 RepID=A0A1I1I3X6_9GAMM|nr:PhzF family phenazine biosynthesis protein [Pseudoalteromonas denitrificans]SFC28918.1 phenazine biosynthesis protein PhzF family [Pseudoalteromonas denitrificans DSM 6059]
MKHAIFQVDAFTNSQFKGNPAAVIPLDKWLDNEVLQKIAAENNLSETAFYIINDDIVKLRWFTPETEVDLCGHATLATAWVLVNEFNYQNAEIQFETRSGILTVRHFEDVKNHNEQVFELELPIKNAQECDIKSPLLSAFGRPPLEILSSDDYLLLFENEQVIKDLKPDFALLKQLPLRGVIVTAPGDNVDFVSRWFGPNVGVNEDPVTGSAHTSLTPYWASKLDKTLLTAKQISQRGGEIECQLRCEKVLLRGKAKLYMKGEIYLV